MKKLLKTLCSAVLVTSAGFTTIACSNSNSSNIVNKKINLATVTQSQFAKSGVNNIQQQWQNLTLGSFKTKIISMLSQVLFANQKYLSIGDFSNFVFYTLNPDGASYNLIDTSGMTDQTTLSNFSKQIATDNYDIYVVFQASKNSTNISGTSGQLCVTLNSVSDQEIANAVATYIKNKFNTNPFDFITDATATVTTVVNYINQFIPNKNDIISSFANRNFNYSPNLVKVTPSTTQKNINPGDQLFATKISYNNDASIAQNFNINTSWEKIAGAEISQAFTNGVFKNFVLDNNHYPASDINNAGNLANDISDFINKNVLTKDAVQSNVKVAPGTAAGDVQLTKNVGTSGATIKINFINTDNNSYITDESGSTKTFTFQATTSLISSFAQLQNEFNNPTSSLNTAPSLSLQTLKLDDLLPDASDFQDKTDVANALKTTVKQFLQDFFAPEGTFGKLLDNCSSAIVPLQSDVTTQALDIDMTSAYGQYVTAIKTAFTKEFGFTTDGSSRDIADGALSLKTNTTSESGYKIAISVDLYNCIKSLGPDIINFHWYIKDYFAKHPDFAKNPNYILLLLNYLDANKQSYNNDNFAEDINSGNTSSGKIVTNGDNLLHDLLSGFVLNNGSYSKAGISMYVDSEIAQPGISYDSITSDIAKNPKGPWYTIFEKSINNILNPISGYDITKPLNVSSSVYIYVSNTWPVSELNGNYAFSFNFNLESLHETELKQLILQQEPWFNPADGYKILVVSQAGKSEYSNVLFLQQYIPDPNNPGQWMWKDIHSLDDLTTNNPINLRFDFRGLSFKVQDIDNPGINFTISGNQFGISKDFYLTF